MGAPLLLDTLVSAVSGGMAPTGAAEAMGGLAAGRVMATMPDISVEGVASQALLAAGSDLQLQLGGGSGSGGLFDKE